MANIMSNDPAVIWQTGCRPEADGDYLVTWYGKTGTMGFTKEYGWNTHIASDGPVSEYAINDEVIEAWALFPAPFGGK